MDRAGGEPERLENLDDVYDLYVCDGSAFVTSPASNPSLTIQAIAARTAARLIEAGKRNELERPADHTSKGKMR